MVWYGMVWYGMVWYGMVYYSMVWYGMVWYGMVIQIEADSAIPDRAFRKTVFPDPGGPRTRVNFPDSILPSDGSYSNNFL